jgi:hypothetical protein
MIDINKYKNKRFSKSKFIDKRIKALFLFYDKNVDELKLSYIESIKSINHMIKVLVESEEYELANAFRKRKILKYKKWRKGRRVWSFRLFYRLYRFRLNRFVKKLLK